MTLLGLVALALFAQAVSVASAAPAAMSSELGFTANLEPDAAPARRAPEDARTALLALARDSTVDARISRLEVSLWWFTKPSWPLRRSGVPYAGVRYSAFKALAGTKDSANKYVLQISNITMQDLLEGALSQSAVAAGSQRSSSSFVPDSEHVELHVREWIPEQDRPQAVFDSYLMPEEGRALAEHLVAVLRNHDPHSASRLKEALELSRRLSARKSR
jgi:hypothetical protein